MKKILAMVLASVLVLACGSVLPMTAQATDGVAENVAPRATYTLHEPYRMGGADVNWGYDPNAAISYPDETGTSLTDGAHAASCDYGDTAWVGLSHSHPDFKGTANPVYVDFALDQTYEVGKARIYLNNLCKSGIEAPVAVTAMISEDGTNFTGETLGAYESEPVAGEACVMEIGVNAETKYIRFCFYPVSAANAAASAGAPAWLAELANPAKSNVWAFFDEIEIFTTGVIKDSWPLFITHYNPSEDQEGSGVIWTETDLGGGWDHHLAFKPVKGKKTVFELVEMNNGSTGAGATLSVPEGGFVLTCNQGNNWPVITAGATGNGTGGWWDDEYHLGLPNYNTENVKQTWYLLPTLEVGQIYTFEGLDLDGKTVPTSTPDKDYWDPEYVCTATITKGDWEPYSYEGDIEERTGDDPSDPAFRAHIKEEWNLEDAVFTLTLDGFRDEDGISTILFPVFYDDARLEPAMTALEDGSLDLEITGLPGEDSNAWENLSVLFEADNDSKMNNYPGRAHVFVQLTNPNDADALCDYMTVITMTLKFRLKGEETEGGLWMENSETRAMNWDFGFEAGSAGFSVIEIPEADPMILVNSVDILEYYPLRDVFGEIVLTRTNGDLIKDGRLHISFVHEETGDVVYETEMRTDENGSCTVEYLLNPLEDGRGRFLLRVAYTERAVTEIEQTFEISFDPERGDMDFDKTLGIRDYWLMKRAVLRNYTPHPFAITDLNLDGEFNAKDYLLLKRVVLGTAQLP